MHGDPSSTLALKRLQLKTKELESKLEFEHTTRSRLEVGDTVVWSRGGLNTSNYS